MKLFDELTNRQDNWLKLWTVLSVLAALICAKVPNLHVLVLTVVLYSVFCAGMMYRLTKLSQEEY